MASRGPLRQDLGPGYSSAVPGLPSRPLPAMSKTSRGPPDMRQLCKAFLNLVGPPMLFMFVSSLLSFKLHFQLEGLIWVPALAALLVPAYLAHRTEKHAMENRLDRSWPRLSMVLFTIAAVSGIIFGALNYWYSAWPSYALEGLRVYHDIDASETQGARLLDSGLVNFAKGSHVMTDLAMSYTDQETYCVAPITTNRGKKTKDTGLASYDLWAAGVGCCSPGQSNFKCGEFANPDARQGLRLVDPSQLEYFQLAVQQAEAAYNLQVGHPLFFTWVKDADAGLGNFFQTAFKNFVVANVFHAGFNLVCVVAFVVLFAGSGKDTGLAALDEL